MHCLWTCQRRNSGIQRGVFSKRMRFHCKYDRSIGFDLSRQVKQHSKSAVPYTGRIDASLSDVTSQKKGTGSDWNGL